MDILQAVVLGAVQGITEFLPISSSGHLILFPELFGWQSHDYDFDVMLHLATMLAVVWVLRDDLLKIVKGVFRKKNPYGLLGWKIVVATLPVVVFGLILSGGFVDDVRDIRFVAANLMIWGAVLWAADWYFQKVKNVKDVKDVKKVGWRQAMVIGFFQVLALIPGTSRSGITMSAGLFFGLDRVTVAKFSFLLAVPAIAGAVTLTSLDVAEHGFSTPIGPLVFGFVSAFIFGALAIKFLLKFLAKSDFRWFAAYRIILGILLFIFLV